MKVRQLWKAVGVVGIFATSVLYQSCDRYKEPDIPNNLTFHQRLSDYQIFKGDPAELVPNAGFTLYELATPLYSDYSEKQRLIKLPEGKILKATGDGLPDFPDGTILVKTFYYDRDKRNPALGRTILETRLLIKEAGKWNVGTYVWNEQQSEATLVTSGLDRPVAWTDERGTSQRISYHVPSNTECNTCHQTSNAITPIGPKLRNLNRDVSRSGRSVNQLQFLQEQSVFSALTPASFARLPNWANAGASLEERARAYLDVNCGHCHSSEGYCASFTMRLTYEASAQDARIHLFKKNITQAMERGRMPMVGVRVVHREGLELIKRYVATLPNR